MMHGQTKIKLHGSFKDQEQRRQCASLPALFQYSYQKDAISSDLHELSIIPLPIRNSSLHIILTNRHKM